MQNFFRKLLVLTVLIIASVSTAAVVSANDTISVIVNGQEVSFAGQGPVIVDGRTLVPIREVFEAMGFSVDWHEDTSTALISPLPDNDGIFSIAIQVGAPNFSIAVFDPDSPFPGHAAIIELDVPAQIIGGRTMLPLRVVLESISYRLDWDEAANTVLIAPAAGDEAVLADPIVNIRHFLGWNMEEVRDLLGNQTDSIPAEAMGYSYFFDTGLQIGAEGPEDGRVIMSVLVDYQQVDNRFHFDRINGQSTYDDVTALLGSEPYNIRQRDIDPIQYDSLGAAFSYGYFVDGSDNDFIRFFFDDDNRVVGISLFRYSQLTLF